MATKRRRKSPAPEGTGEIVVKVDEKQVDEAVAKINHILQDTLFKAVTAVGDYLFHVFFHDDPALVSSKDPNKTASFRALAERCGAELPISKSWLHNAVGVAVMRRALPDGATYKLLPPSHQTALLPLRNPLTAEKLAKRATDKKMSVRQLKEVVNEEVAKGRDDESPRGRPRTPTITKALVRADKVFTFDDGRRFTKAMLDELGEDEVPGTIKAAKSLVARLTVLIEKLEARA